jgi:hypothetical protein
MFLSVVATMGDFRSFYYTQVSVVLNLHSNRHPTIVLTDKSNLLSNRKVNTTKVETDKLIKNLGLFIYSRMSRRLVQGDRVRYTGKKVVDVFILYLLSIT